MTEGVDTIFTKLAGAVVGLLLVIYGSVSLWLDKGTTASAATKRAFCEFMLCQQPSADSPTAILPPPDKSLAGAQADLAINPASAYRWADLADSEINANSIDKGKFCLRQALASAPGNPAILFRASNFYLRLEDYPEALKHLLAVLRNPDLADYYDKVFALYSQMDLPLDTLLNQGLPHTPQAANAFLRFWIHQNRLDEARETWTWINQNALTSLQSAGSYVALLATDARWDEAIKSWSDFTATVDTEYRRTNWIYNGGFETVAVDCPFDWHLLSTDAGEAVRDKDLAYKGTASLRLRYSGSAKSADPEAYQIVVLQPGKWRLKAVMKTQALTGNQGVVIRVVDAEDPGRLDVATNTFQRTQEWTGVSKIFDVPVGTRRAKVEISRPLVRDLDSRSTGNVWIDALQLTPEP